eukprot:761416-Hanusia_phi.AAC.2
MFHVRGTGLVVAIASFLNGQSHRDDHRMTTSLPEPRPLEYDGSKVPPSKPLVIDAGSHSTRAGWAGEKDPCVVLRSLVGKAKDGKGDLVTLAGDQLLCKDISKTMVRSPFEKVLTKQPLWNQDDKPVFRMSCSTMRAWKHSWITPYTGWGSKQTNCITLSWSPKWGGKASHGLIVRVGHSSSNVIPIYDGAAGFKVTSAVNSSPSLLSSPLLFSRSLPSAFPLPFVSGFSSC